MVIEHLWTCGHWSKDEGLCPEEYAAPTDSAIIPHSATPPLDVPLYRFDCPRGHRQINEQPLRLYYRGVRIRHSQAADAA